jgi:hypothetical protein
METWGMIRGQPPVELPEHARERLAEIGLQRMQAEDGMRACQSRINSLADENADADLQARLTVERDRHSARHQTISRIYHHVNQFLMESRGVTFAPAPEVEIKLKNGETVASAIEGVRAETKTLRDRLAVVKAAPLPAAEQMTAAQEFVTRRALTAQPKILVQRDALRVHWADDVIMSKTDVLNLLCFFLPEHVLAALQSIIGEQSPSNALAADERNKQIVRISERVFQLGILEEGLILL